MNLISRMMMDGVPVGRMMMRTGMSTPWEVIRRRIMA
jgi:hypothetical protein